MARPRSCGAFHFRWPKAKSHASSAPMARVKQLHSIPLPACFEQKKAGCCSTAMTLLPFPREIASAGTSAWCRKAASFGPACLLKKICLMGCFLRQFRPKAHPGLERIYGLFPRLKERRHQMAGTLSGGEQQMCAIGRGLMSEPQLLMLDEPSLGLAPKLVDEIFEFISNIANQGVTILLVGQNVNYTLQISHYGYVMETGRITLKAPRKC